MKTLSIFDHDGSIENKEVIKEAVKKTEGVEYISSCLNSDVCFCHSGSKEKWEEIVHKSKSGSVRVKMTRAGGLASTELPIKTDNGVFILKLASYPNEINEDEWMSIIEFLVDKNGQKDMENGSIPNELKKYFFIEKVVEYTAALAILCQGYMLANHNDPGCEEEIEWDKITASKEIKNRLSNESGKVMKIEWWTKVLGTEKTNVENKLEEEFSGNIPCGIKGLINSIYPDGTKHDKAKDQTTVEPGIVVDAYKDIKKKLGGA